MTNEELTDRDEGNKAALTQAASTVGGGVCWGGVEETNPGCAHIPHIAYRSPEDDLSFHLVLCL